MLFSTLKKSYFRLIPGCNGQMFGDIWLYENRWRVFGTFASVIN